MVTEVVYLPLCFYSQELKKLSKKMEGKRQIDQQDMQAMEDRQQQQHQVEVQTHPPRQCPRCNSWETMFGYYNIFGDNQPRYRCKRCSLYWIHGEVPSNISVGGKRKNNQHSEAASTSTNRVCKIPRSVENPILSSSSSVRINGQRDPISRTLFAEGNGPSSPSPLMGINEPRTFQAPPVAPAVTQSATNIPGLRLAAVNFAVQCANHILSAIPGGVSRHPYPHGLPEQHQQIQQQQFFNSQNYWDGNVTQNNNINELQAPVNVVVRSTTVLRFPPSLNNFGSVSNPEALWNINVNNNNIGQFQTQGTPFQHSTTVPDFQASFNSAGGAPDPYANLVFGGAGGAPDPEASFNSAGGIGGLPLNPPFWPDNHNF
ncbi:hypothetical protein FRX31_006311 [Thalictrum thalictroides]|uniref:Dof zinc finger protein n=1 Tax=Thalictrum thalictroides TaxID=46969 RepID=A0A7J6X2V6_THATH|nr:hypothetical protein FRX31_006311 [Thalictrum thalictroides]